MEALIISVTTTGAAGSATGDTTSAIVLRGKLHAVYLDYNASAPGATTDVAISQAQAPSATLLTVTNNATDGWYFPRQQVCDTAGAALTYDGSEAVSEPLPVDGKLTVAVAQSNALAPCVTAYLYIED